MWWHVGAASWRRARDVDANVTDEKGYPSLHCAITAISLPLKEQLIVSRSMAPGWQRGFRPALTSMLLESKHSKDLNSAQRRRNWDMFVSPVSAGQDAMEHPGELTLAVLSSTSGHPSSKAGCKTHIPKTPPGAGKPFYKFTLSTHGAWRGSSLLLALSKAL